MKGGEGGKGRKGGEGENIILPVSVLINYVNSSSRLVSIDKVYIEGTEYLDVYDR